jgi:hypothetical protein
VAFQPVAFQIDAFQQAGASAPILLGPIPSQRERQNSGNYELNTGDYFSGADSYAIAPAVETGWNFNTTTGLLTFDTDAVGIFGSYVVTATNTNGDKASNAFNVEIYVVSGGAGRPRRRRKYFVEIDGQSFPVDSVAEAQALLEQARQIAPQHAEQEAEAAVQQAQVTGEPIRIVIPKISASKALQPVVREHKAELARIYSEANKRANLELAMRAALEEEEDEAITVLLLH